MKPENLNLYLENLLPGIVILSSILLLIPSSPYATNLIDEFRKSEIILSILFLATSYLLGLISALVSRMVVDNLSERFPRPMFLISLSHRTYDELKDLFKSYEIILPSMGSDKRKVWNSEYRTAWNKAYREALGTVLWNAPEKVAEEVQRRREQGRLVRNLFFPLLTSALVIILRILQLKDWWTIILICGLVLLVSIFLYAYAEYFNFAEAILVLKKKELEKTSPTRKAKDAN